MTTIVTGHSNPDDVVATRDRGTGTVVTSGNANTDGGIAEKNTGFKPLATSCEIRDRGSTFVGQIYRVRTTEEARAVVGWRRQRDLERKQDREKERQRQSFMKGKGLDDTDGDGRNKDKEDVPTPYTIAAWRCMVVKSGRTGLGGLDEFEVERGSDDGGERYAGRKILEVMQREGVIDAAVIVSRWFGGTLLGPARFAHVDTCASEVCRKFKKVEEMEECIQTLQRHDDTLAGLRAQLATILEGAGTADPSSTRDIPDSRQAKTHKAPDYRMLEKDLDLNKAKRLLRVRESAIQNTKALIEKYKSST